MEVRGAPLIGGTAAYGMALAVKENKCLKHLHFHQFIHIYVCKHACVQMGSNLHKRLH